MSEKDLDEKIEERINYYKSLLIEKDEIINQLEGELSVLSRYAAGKGVLREAPPGEAFAGVV